MAAWSQIFRFDNTAFSEPRAYGECSEDQRDAFVLDLFRKIEHKLTLRGTGRSKAKPIDPILDLQLFDLASKAYQKRAPKYFLDSQELSTEQKAELFDRVVLAERGHAAKNNPYSLFVAERDRQLGTES